MKANSRIPSLENKTHLIFDLDGTLIDSLNIWNIVDQKTLEFFGSTASLLQIQKLHTTFFKQDNNYLNFVKFLIGNCHVNATPEQFLKVRWEIADTILATQVDFKQGVVETLKKLKKKFILILATSSTQHILSIYTHKNKRMSSKLELETFFDTVLTQEDIPTGRGKPCPDIYLDVMKKYTIKAKECLVFEDSLEGIQAAKGAGLDVVHVDDSFIPDEDKILIQKLTPYYLKNWQDFKI